jgi:hypothetical protein
MSRVPRETETPQFGEAMAAALTDAAVVVAAILADPFDPAARTEARLWLRAWRMALQDRAASTAGAAKRALLTLVLVAVAGLTGCGEGLTLPDTAADASAAPSCNLADGVPTVTDGASGWTCIPTPGAYQGQCSCSGPPTTIAKAAEINVQLCPLVHACADAATAQGGA